MKGNKVQLRNHFKRVRDQLTKRAIKVKSQNIFNAITSHKYYLEARTVFVYMSMQSEVDTSDFIKASLSRGKKVAIPKIITLKDGRKTMKFYELKHYGDVITGYYGILEPKSKDVLIPQDNDLMIVPGLCFSIEGYRIGYGGGFYDRYILKHKDSGMHSIGVVYESQVVDDLPYDYYDEPVQLIVTDKRIILTSNDHRDE